MSCSVTDSSVAALHGVANAAQRYARSSSLMGRALVIGVRTPSLSLVDGCFARLTYRKPVKTLSRVSPSVLAEPSRLKASLWHHRPLGFDRMGTESALGNHVAALHNFLQIHHTFAVEMCWSRRPLLAVHQVRSHFRRRNSALVGIPGDDDHQACSPIRAKGASGTCRAPRS